MGIFFKLYLKKIDSIYALAGIFLIVFAVSSLYFQTIDSKKSMFEDNEGQSTYIYGRVLSINIKDDNFCKITVKTTQGEKVLINVSGVLKELAVKIPQDITGRNIRAKGVIELPSSKRNPGGFDNSLYLKTKGIKIIIKSNVNCVRIINGDLGKYSKVNLIMNKLALLKYGYLSKLESILDIKAYSLLSGMLFGDKTLLDDDIYEAFQRNGVAHILSVSGIHVAIVYLYINKLMGNRRNWLFSCISILLLIFYAALAEFSASVVRAVCMITVHILSKLIYRRYDLLTGVCSCALVMLLINPYYLFSIGFQLSYLAVLCLSVILPWINRRIEFLSEGRCPEFIIKLLLYLSPLLTIQLGLIPYTAYYFNYFSIAAFFLNIPIIAISSIIIPIGICLILIYIFSLFPFLEIFVSHIFGIGAVCLELMLNIMAWLNDLFYKSQMSYVNVVSPSVCFLLLYYIFIFFSLSEWFRIMYQRKKWRKIIFITIFFVTISFILPIVFLEDYSKVSITFLDVGQGDCLILKTPKGKNLLFDGGGNINYDIGKKVLLPYLLKNGIDEIDLALVSHIHDDHFLGMASLAKEMNIKKLGIYAANKYRQDYIIKNTGLSEKNLLYLTKGQRIFVENDIWIEVLYPCLRIENEYKELIKEDADENMNSLLLKIHYLDLEILMTGDMGFNEEKEVLKIYESAEENILNSDILKVGHHGSKYSTSDEFLNVISPKLAVIQVGKNKFGHPSKAVIEKCKKSGIIVYRNDLNGAIMFWKGNQWHIKTML